LDVGQCKDAVDDIFGARDVRSETLWWREQDQRSQKSGWTDHPEMIDE
jgi:hypothetical protein